MSEIKPLRCTLHKHGGWLHHSSQRSFTVTKNALKYPTHPCHHYSTKYVTLNKRLTVSNHMKHCACKTKI
jgi:hypothetical protein